MPKVGKTKYPYTKKGIKQAKRDAKARGQKVQRSKSQRYK